MDNDSPQIRLDHINLPARKPAWLAEWYAEMFGFRAEEGFVIGPGTLLVFEEGEPIDYRGRIHFGFRSNSHTQVASWAEKLGVDLDQDEHYAGFKARDPEGNLFEVYWETNR